MDGVTTDLDALRRQGAAARAAGLSFFANPFYRAENMPGNTGEPREAWGAKCDAWELGWQLEDTLRALGAP